ncbi:MAG: FliM/FliN family flagellar motor C-terminal domain-containing protein [Pirellulaceae bacterium]
MADSLLKPYCRSIMQVSVPVVVTLARKRMPIEQVLKLVPGMMIQFDKHCDSPMTVEVCDQPIAEGEIVKAGDMFGIRVGEILMPSERFMAVASNRDQDLQNPSPSKTS